MTDAFEQIRNSITDTEEVWRTHPNFYLFEPWNCRERTRRILDQAMADSVDLASPDLARCIGSTPHDFQTGYLMSTCFGRVLIAGSQLGKSLVEAVEIVTRTSGEIPLSLRYSAGHDTGVPRMVTPENIRRWGRRNKETGEIIDYNVAAARHDGWDCGNVIGAGVFPADKIVPPGTMIRLVSYQSMILQNWWPAFTGESESQLAKFIPKHFIDKTRGSSGNRGYNKQDHQIFMPRGCTIQMLTYEAEKRSLEGILVPTYLDEEWRKDDLIGALVSHATDWSLGLTPWRGITWSKDYAFPKVVSPQKKTFHATAYDCPYKTEEAILNTRGEIEDKPWEIAARLWGIPAQQKGKPYYDRAKINLWLQRFQMPFKWVSFQPTQECYGIKTDLRISGLPGLLDVPVRMIEHNEDDQQARWRLYEDREPGIGYCNASDQAEGAETPEEAGDLSTDVMGRMSDDDPTRPVVVATLRSTLSTPQFARETLYACRYFNNAILAPEMGKGAANASFEMVAMDWPWWFKDVVTRWATRKTKEQRGFCPTHDRREAVFNKLIRDWFDTYDKEEYPDIPDEWILREAAAAIEGKTHGGLARCDHPSDGTLDSLTAYGILLFVFTKENNRQIRCHGGDRPPEKRKSWIEQMQERNHLPERPVFLGETVKNLR